MVTWVKVNKALLKSALHRCKKVTLDIDATEIVVHKAQAQWTDNKNKGFMPMVGHIAKTEQIVDVDFRQGNACGSNVLASCRSHPHPQQSSVSDFLTPMKNYDQ